MAGDLRAGRQSTRGAKRVSTLTDDDVGNATHDVGRCHDHSDSWGYAATLRNPEPTVPPLDRIPEFDLYAELDVAPGADAEAIERAWRAGVRSVHPDLALSGEERAATTRTVRLNLAREWLMDPSKRARYDLLRRPGRRVEIPTVDPLGSWPARPRRRRPHLLAFLLRGIVVSLLIMAVVAIIGIGSSVTTVMIFGASFAIAVLFGIYAIVWVLVGAMTRRLN